MTGTAADHHGFLVVLTGGIASGKTAVSDRLRELGATVIDTDLIAREVVAPGQDALGAIVARFGHEILDEAGRLDRSRMRRRIFADPNDRKALEAIVHPAIRRVVAERLVAATGPYCVLVIPLWAESGGRYEADRVLVVDVDEETQIDRVINRDGVDRDQAASILAAQASREDRLALADDVIRNDATLESLNRSVDALHRSYLTLAAEKRRGTEVLKQLS